MHHFGDMLNYECRIIITMLAFSFKWKSCEMKAFFLNVLKVFQGRLSTASLGYELVLVADESHQSSRS